MPQVPFVQRGMAAFVDDWVPGRLLPLAMSAGTNSSGIEWMFGLVSAVLSDHRLRYF